MKTSLIKIIVKQLPLRFKDFSELQHFETTEDIFYTLITDSPLVEKHSKKISYKYSSIDDMFQDDVWGIISHDDLYKIVHKKSGLIVYHTCNYENATRLIKHLRKKIPNFEQQSKKPLMTKKSRNKLGVAIRMFRPYNPKVIYFSSGLNLPGEITAMLRKGIAPGVTASLYSKSTGRHRYMTPKLENVIKRERLENVPVFIDSGAFSVGQAQKEYLLGKIKVQPTPLDWSKVFEIYSSLGWGETSDEYNWYVQPTDDPTNKFNWRKDLFPNYMVAPDVVGDPHATLELIKTYKNDLIELRDDYPNNFLIVALHNSEDMDMIEFDREVTKILGDDWIRGYPMVRGATHLDDFIRHLDGIRPKRIHLLGLGYLGTFYRSFMEAILCLIPDSNVSMDSVRITALVGRKEGKPDRPLAIARDAESKVLKEKKVIENIIEEIMTKNIPDEFYEIEFFQNLAILNGFDKLTYEPMGFSLYEDIPTGVIVANWGALSQKQRRSFLKKLVLYDVLASKKVQKEQTKKFRDLLLKSPQEFLPAYLHFLTTEVNQDHRGKNSRKDVIKELLYNLIDVEWHTWALQWWRDSAPQLALSEFHRRKTVGSIERLTPRQLGLVHNPKKFTVTSEKEGERLLNHKDIVSNWKKSMRVRPKNKKAILLPCASTKPFEDAPSHKHGYLKALQNKGIDIYVVSEPLGIVPYKWNDIYPNNAYDFPPKYLKGKAKEILMDRFSEWVYKYHPKYSTIYATLPIHHGDMIDRASDDLPIIDLSISRYRDESGDNQAFRATNTNYIKWLQKKIRT